MADTRTVLECRILLPDKRDGAAIELLASDSRAASVQTVDGNPEVADWEIKWQVEHGIDFEQYCW